MQGFGYESIQNPRKHFVKGSYLNDMYFWIGFAQFNTRRLRYGVTIYALDLDLFVDNSEKQSSIRPIGVKELLKNTFSTFIDPLQESGQILHYHRKVITDL